jgi:quinoprotein glucose dehydrogenase
MSLEDLDPFFLSPDERAEWTTRLRNARNEGLFTPPGYQRDTVQVPGARGGSNWGTTSSDPDHGLVYLTSQDWPSIVNVEGTEIGAARNGGAAPDPAQATYQQSCAACHGADRAGTPTGPSLIGVGDRVTPAAFDQLLSTGRGQMPANPAIPAATRTALYAFATGGTGTGRAARGGGAGGGAGAAAPSSTPMTGPVVASGGAPGGLEPRLNEAQMRAAAGGGNRFVGPPYPGDVVVPSVRLYSDYGLNYPFIINPPWSSIVAYDLNSGTIKWRKPLGEDRQAVAEGGHDTGVLQGGEHRSIVVTATGLLFVNGPDGKVRAYDADNGNVLWTYTMPAGTNGMPAMYEVAGRQFLVVQASGGPAIGRSAGNSGGGGGRGGATVETGYIAFALPR